MASTSTTVSKDDSSVLLNALETFAINALKSKLSNSNNLKNYYRMIEELNTLDTSSLDNWYTILLKTVNYITVTNELKEFIAQIYNFNFNCNNVQTIKIYLHFLNTLVSANIDFLIPTLKIMGQNLLYNAKLHEAGNLDAVFNLINNSINTLIHTVPSSTTSLYHILVDLYPYKSHDIIDLKVFVKNLLCITEYIPELRDRLLELIIDRLLSLDVEIYNYNINDINSSNNKIANNIDNVNNVVKVGTLNLEILNKLDALLYLLFEYMELAKGLTLCDKVFDSLMACFERAIINTYQSKYVQLLLFYCTSFKHGYAEIFLKRVMEKSVDGSLLIRQCSAQYMASFLVRSIFMRQSTRLMCFEIMISWLLTYIDANQDIPDIDLECHSAFYSICQAVFCVIAFHPETFVSVLESNERTLEDYNLDRLVSCSLNPLRFCNAELIERFTNVTFAMNWIDCREIINNNKRLLTMVSTSFALLINYFPFDHNFELPLSSKFLENIYFHAPTEPTINLNFKRRDSSDGTGTSCPMSLTQPHYLAVTPSMGALTPSIGAVSHSNIMPEFSLNERGTSSMRIQNNRNTMADDAMALSFKALSFEEPAANDIRSMLKQSSKKKKEKKHRSYPEQDEEIQFDLN